MLRTHSTEMHPLLLLTIIMWALMAMAAAQLRCDPLTQYEKDGQCCKMCGPGTRMSSSGTCLDPQCTECGDNEYQDKYTSETKCQRHRYCDPNMNFQVDAHKSKTERSTCICKEGFHCSSGQCITCLSHTSCKPGYGAQTKGNHTHDTVCQKCVEGTFSNDNSWDGVCKKWTECKNGYHIKQEGTEMSDNICEETTRRHVVVICLVTLVIMILIALAIYCVCRGKQGGAGGKIKVCFESCRGDTKEPLKETKVLITTPVYPTEEESVLPEPQSSQEEGGAGTPEENEDQPSQEMSADVGFTDMGNYVTQENGKSVVISRQESQTQTFID